MRNAALPAISIKTVRGLEHPACFDFLASLAAGQNHRAVGFHIEQVLLLQGRLAALGEIMRPSQLLAISIHKAKNLCGTDRNPEELLQNLRASA